jgi:diaminohydroxyphosphoribosylaminopyrimidine deaminase/5-amino-6-(5-phosphoribosylamino)uracil reductase
MVDPNPLVAGQGLAMLAAAGIAVASGLLEAEARELNVGFVARMTRGQPWLRLKLAASLDGKTALLNGRSQWITGTAARRDGHRWRARACAILTGIGTVRDDDPSLTVRAVETTRQPLRVVVDSRLEIALGAKVLCGGNTLIATATEDFGKIAALAAAGAEVLVLPNAHGKVDLEQLLRELARRGINEIHVEAGFKLNGSLLRAGLVDELLLYQAPTLLGDHARGMFDLAALVEMSGRRDLQIFDQRNVGSDLRLLARWRE